VEAGIVLESFDQKTQVFVVLVVLLFGFSNLPQGVR
jgi:hypothetical protein